MKALGLPHGGVVVTLLMAACGAGSDSQKGVLPKETPRGEVAAVTFDVSRNRLIKAYPHALSQSRTSGRSWEPIPIPPSVRRGQIMAVAVSTKAPGTLYIAGRGFGVLRSQDEGATWRRLNRGLPNRAIDAFAIHTDLENTLYAAVEGGGVYRTEDGGQTWKRMDGGPDHSVGLLFHSNLGGSMKTGWLYAGTSDGVQRSMDCFCGWRQAGTLPGQNMRYSVVSDPDRPERLYASGAAGVFRSRDGGESWEQSSSGGPELVALAFDPSADVLYAATREGSILRSRDQGALWERVDE